MGRKGKKYINKKIKIPPFTFMDAFGHFFIHHASMSIYDICIFRHCHMTMKQAGKETP